MAQTNVEPIEVHCYSGYKADERPIALVFRDRRLAVVKVVKSWFEEDVEPGKGTKTFFRVKADDDRAYVIFHDQRSDEWFLDQGHQNKH